jgi:hypothetical protein
MRRYDPNSPHAAARVVALTLLADGAVSRCELGMLFRWDVCRRLGVDNVEMQLVLEDLARDLYEFGTPAWGDAGGLHPLVVQCVLDDVTDPALRREVLAMCQSLAEADSHLSDGECLVLDRAHSHWRLAAPSNFVKGA